MQHLLMIVPGGWVKSQHMLGSIAACCSERKSFSCWLGHDVHSIVRFCCGSRASTPTPGPQSGSYCLFAGHYYNASFASCNTTCDRSSHLPHMIIEKHFCDSTGHPRSCCEAGGPQTRHMLRGLACFAIVAEPSAQIIKGSRALRSTASAALATFDVSRTAPPRSCGAVSMTCEAPIPTVCDASSTEVVRSSCHAREHQIRQGTCMSSQTPTLMRS